MENTIESMNWRYATKKFDKNKKISESLFNNITEALRLSPSSYGLQPWKFVIVNNDEIRARLRVAGYDQPQITDASHLIIFANKKNVDSNLVDEYINFTSKESGVEVSNLAGFEGMIKGSFSGKTNEELRSWAAHQVYLALGVLLTTCAVLKVDACPMEGFDNGKVDEILKLSDLNLESKVIVALGYRAQDDDHASHKKIRFPKEDVFIELN